jgi:hypothetical protein
MAKHSDTIGMDYSPNGTNGSGKLTIGGQKNSSVAKNLAIASSAVCEGEGWRIQTHAPGLSGGTSWTDRNSLNS